MTQFEPHNVSMMMDLYEMTMANGYFGGGNADGPATFDVFYRRNPDEGGFAIFAGLEQVLDYLENVHFEKEDIDYLRSLDIYEEKFLEEKDIQAIFIPGMAGGLPLPRNRDGHAGGQRHVPQRADPYGVCAADRRAAGGDGDPEPDQPSVPDRHEDPPDRPGRAVAGRGGLRREESP